MNEYDTLHGKKGTCMVEWKRIHSLSDDAIPDLIIIYGGTNDAANMLSKGYSTGAFVYRDSFDEKIETWDSFADGMQDMILRMKNAYPKARILMLQLPYLYNNNGWNEKASDINTIIQQCCDAYENVDTLKMRDIDFRNGLDQGVVKGTHFNAATHEILGKAIGDYISAKYGW